MYLHFEMIKLSYKEVICHHSILLIRNLFDI